MNRWMDEWMDEWLIDRSVEGWTGKYFRSRRQTDRLMDWIDIYLDGWMIGKTGWMNGNLRIDE